MANPLPTKFNVAPALSVPYRTTEAGPSVGAIFDARPYPTSAIFFEVKIIAVYADGSAAAAYWLQAAFRTDESGVLTQIGATTVVSTVEDTGGMAVTIAAGSETDSGTGTGTDDNQIQVTVTGVADTTINWVLDNTIRHAPFTR